MWGKPRHFHYITESLSLKVCSRRDSNPGIELSPARCHSGHERLE